MSLRAATEPDPPGDQVDLLRQAFEQALAQVHGEIAPQHPELRSAHLQVFRFGGVEGRRITDLATRGGMTKQSMHELIGHLERHGYLHREPDPVDVRARLVRLTEHGRRLQEQVQHAVDRLHRNWCARLGGERCAALWSALREITTPAQPPVD